METNYGNDIVVYGDSDSVLVKFESDATRDEAEQLDQVWNISMEACDRVTNYLNDTFCYHCGFVQLEFENL